MQDLDRQTEYWNRVADCKTFTHPLNVARLRSLLAPDARILDYGCGYGRACSELRELGFERVVGVDIAAGMIARARRLQPGLTFQTLTDARTPFDDATFDAVLLFAVLTCIPSDAGQRDVVAELRRVLKPGGLVVVSDYLIQPDERNRRRYAEHEGRCGVFGVFELSDGAVVRHHKPEWIETLLSDFERVGLDEIVVPTMNGHPARVFQYFGRKPARA